MVNKKIITFDNFGDEEECKEDVKKLLESENEKITEMIESCNRKIIHEDENLRKELKTLKKKVNNLKEEGDSVKEKELLKMQMETIKELIKKNNELMEKGLFEAVGRGMDKIVDKSSSGFFNSPNVVVFSATFGFLLRKLILWYQLSSTSYNQLTSLNVNSCQKLKYISCGFNKLTNLDLTNLTQLKIIECNDNHLTKFDYSSLKNSEKLTYLNIKHLVNDIYNKFTGSLEPLKDLKQLKDLHISFEHLEGLERLACGKTVIKDELTKYENKANHDTSSVISLERLFVIRIGGSLVLIGQSDTENPNSQLYTQTGGVIAIVSPFMEILTSYINDKLFEVRQAEWDAFVEDAKNLLDNYHDLQVMLGGIEKKEVGEVNTALNDLRDKTKTFLDKYDEDGNGTINVSELIEKKKKK
ncbi:10664_t:CDS:2 [Entrophospora sp. SA101]|nr:10664_t:CDS:2 [Entrophospora sp. SA101]